MLVTPAGRNAAGIVGSLAAAMNSSTESCGSSLASREAICCIVNPSGKVISMNVSSGGVRRRASTLPT